MNEQCRSSAEVKNEWSYTSTPPVCLHGVDRDNFNLINHHLRVPLYPKESTFRYGGFKFLPICVAR
jgi:hypothetical protein